MLIQTQTNGESLARKLRTIPGIVSAEDVSGAYDVVARARSDDSRRFIDGIVAEIRKLPEVTHALPALLIEPPDQLPPGGPWDGSPGSRDEAA